MCELIILQRDRMSKLAVFLLIVSLYLINGLDTNITMTQTEEQNVTYSETSLFENVTDLTSILFETTTWYLTEDDETLRNLTVTYNRSSFSPVPDTTSIPSTTSKAPPAKEEIKPKQCSCDMTKGECDVNCCCDNDCSEIDKKVFDSCYLESDEAQDSGLCYSPAFLYKNNTSYKILKEEKGLFCIAQDNLPERMHYTNQEIVSSFSVFNKIWNRKKHFMWTSIESNEIYQFNNHYYKYGVPVWQYNNTSSSISSIDIPMSLYTGLCESSRPLKYLENVESTCLIDLFSSPKSCRNNPVLNAANLINISLIANPMLVNTSSLEVISEDYLVPIQIFVCAENNTCVETQFIPVPTFDQSSQSCRNILKSAHYFIKHNGSRGIIGTKLILRFDNTSVTKWLMQEHKVTFEWAKNESNIFKRSGIPGYMDGKPLIFGNLVRKKIGDKFEESIYINDEDRQWMTIPKASNNGLCNEKMNILFNHNILSQCSIKLEMKNSSKNCENLHNQVWKVLFDDNIINVSNPQQLDVLISSHGNPMPERVKEWVPIFLERPSEYDFKSSLCPTLISGVRYHILYSYRGSIAKPQAKIIGVLAKIYTSDILCANKNRCLFKVSTSVTFTDVSQKAVRKFAKPPIVRIRLPTDFFYPFTSKAVSSHINFTTFVIINMYFIIMILF